MATVYLGLGSNLGDRQRHLARALAALASAPAIRVAAVSPFIETAAVGGPPGQGKYLNAAALVETDLEPASLLAELKSIEHRLGRRDGPRWGERPIDLDILLYDDLVLDTPDLVIPHPRLAERRFVLEPLVQIAPDARDPRSGLSISALLARLPPC
jgi:2-amino-4-hydroxy-6-hydroxymethyldihydropteridine diphosphokinase